MAVRAYDAVDMCMDVFKSVQKLRKSRLLLSFFYFWLHFLGKQNRKWAVVVDLRKALTITKNISVSVAKYVVSVILAINF